MRFNKDNLASIILVMLILFPLTLFSQNRLDSRMYFHEPKLYDSPTHVVKIKNATFSVSKPIDNREKYYGETVFRKVKVQHYIDFWKKSISNEIREKIINDLNHLTTVDSNQVKSNFNLTIYPTIEVFYPDVRGFIWGKSFAKVRLDFKVITDNNETLLEKKYESFYKSSGLDSEWEGKLLETIENGANITIGITLRKTLDNFYNDLNEKL
jgi:6-pyruvoyl-tetrahydropterin synthase